MQKETKVGAEVEEVPEIHMPEWEKDKKKLKEEQLEDKTLDQERGWADNQERDFEWRNGLLCHINYASPRRSETQNTETPTLARCFQLVFAIISVF